MKKTLLVTIVVLVIAAAAAVYYLLTNLDAIVEAALEKFGSDAVKTSVRVDRVAISLGEGAAAISGLTVDNPAGFSLPHAFALGEIAVDINLEQTGKELIAIDAIAISAPQVFYEINAQREGSLNKLKDNLDRQAAASKDDSVSGAPSGADRDSTLKLRIDRFEFKEASLHARVVPLNDRTYDLKLPPLALNNLKGTPDQIARQVLDRLIEHAKQEIRRQGLDSELAEIKAKARERIDEEKAKLQQQADDRIEEEKQKAGDKLKNLLGR